MSHHESLSAKSNNVRLSNRQSEIELKPGFGAQRGKKLPPKPKTIEKPEKKEEKIS